MTQNKTNRANLENKRGFFLEIGAILALAIMVTAFEWPSVVSRADDLGSLDGLSIEDVDMVPITRTEIAPPPPPAAKQHVAEIIEIIDNEAKVEGFSVDAEADNSTAIEFVDIDDIEPEPDIEEPEELIYDPFSLEEQAAYPGGDLALRKFIAENIRYPEMAKENDIQGTVYVRFLVDKDGSVTGIEVVRGVDPLLDKEATRVISKLQAFKPAKYMGKPVKTRMVMPVKFVLQ